MRARIPPWFTPFWDRTLIDRRWQAVCGLLLGGLPVGGLAVDRLLPTSGSFSGLTVLAVVLAGWTLRCALLLPVLILAGLVELAYAALGEIDPLAAAIGGVALVVLAATGRLGVLGWTHMRDARQHEMSTLLQASHDLGSALDLGGVAAEAVRAAGATVLRPGLAGRRPAVLLRVADGRAALVGACDAAGVTAAGAGETPLGPADPALLRTLESGGTAVASAGQVPAGLGELVRAGPGSAWALARVTVAGQPFGVLGVASPDPDEFRREDLRLLDGIARVAGLAIATALRNAELDVLQSRLQDSVDLALEAGGSLEPADVVACTLVRAAASVDADRATLARVADAGGVVVDATHWPAGGGRPLAVGREFGADAVAAVPDLARALASGRPVLAGPLDAGPAGRELAGALGGGCHTLLFPFVVAGRAAWVLALSRHGGERPFEPADATRLQPMSDVALLALRNAHLYAQAERAELDASTLSERQRHAIEAAESIGSSPELAEVLDGVLRRAVEVSRAERGSISRADDGRMVVDCEHDPTGAVMGLGTVWRMPDSPLAARAVETGRPVQGGRELAVPAGLARWADRAGVEHMIACPLMVGRELVGLLGLSRRTEPFREEELLALQPFATLAALLLRNARLLNEARQVGRAKSAFLNLAAHELRTPLAVIRGYLSMLEDGTYAVPDETREEAVGTLVAKVQELDALVEALLTTARLEVGRLPRVVTRLDVGEAVREALDRIAPRAQMEGARLEARLPEGELLTRADGSHVARILDNLLNNALTYSHRPADVTVAIRRGAAVEVAVRDRGMGIPPEQQDRVFERFYRLDSEISEFTPGLGLGLSISRELALINDGSLCLEDSRPGEGSTFVLRLPLVTGNGA